MTYYNPRFTLQAKCADCIVNNLSKLVSEKENIKALPASIKNLLLKRYVSSRYFWRSINFEDGLELFVHPQVYSLDLSLECSDRTLEIIKICGALRRLDVSGKRVESKEILIDLFDSVKLLTTLVITNCSAVDDDVVNVIVKNCRDLEVLDLSNCINVTGESIKRLSGELNLTAINLCKTAVDDDGIISLVTGPYGGNIKELRLKDCDNVTCAVLPFVAKHCKKLEIFTFPICTDNCTENENIFNRFNFRAIKQVEWTVKF